VTVGPWLLGGALLKRCQQVCPLSHRIRPDNVRLALRTRPGGLHSKGHCPSSVSLIDRGTRKTQAAIAAPTATAKDIKAVGGAKAFRRSAPMRSASESANSCAGVEMFDRHAKPINVPTMAMPKYKSRAPLPIRAARTIETGATSCSSDNTTKHQETMSAQSEPSSWVESKAHANG